MPPFAPTETGNILILGNVHFTQRSREQPQPSALWPAHIYQSNLHDALLSPCALFLLSGLTLGLKLLASQGKGNRQRHEMQFSMFLFPDFG